MKLSLLHPRRFCRAAAVILGLALLGLAGCEQEPIQTYRVARPQTRLLGAIIPRNEKVWFVKMVGAADAMAEAQPNFDSFLRSIRFDDKDEAAMSWALPTDWKAEKQRDRRRYATIRAILGLELSVTQLQGKMAGDKLANVNRWRKQMGLRAVKADDLKGMCTDVEIGDVKNAARVDITGAADELSRVARPPIEFEAPAEWKRVPAKAMQLAAYRAAIAESVEISISEAGGSVIGNVQRWRKQVGLPEGGENEVAAQIKEYKVADEPGYIVDLTGENKTRILGVIVPREDASLFFKMMGPADDIDKVRPAFEQFLTKVRFPDGE